MRSHAHNTQHKLAQHTTSSSDRGSYFIAKLDQIKYNKNKTKKLQRQKQTQRQSANKTEKPHTSKKSIHKANKTNKQRTLRRQMRIRRKAKHKKCKSCYGSVLCSLSCCALSLSLSPYNIYVACC